MSTIHLLSQADEALGHADRIRALRSDAAEPSVRRRIEHRTSRLGQLLAGMGEAALIEAPNLAASLLQGCPRLTLGHLLGESAWVSGDGQHLLAEVEAGHLASAMSRLHPVMTCEVGLSSQMQVTLICEQMQISITDGFWSIQGQPVSASLDSATHHAMRHIEEMDR